MTKKIQKMVLIIIFTMLTISPVFVNAQYTVDQNSRQGAAKATNANDLINGIISIILSFIAALSILMIIVAGIIYITSTGGDRVDWAKKMLQWAIGGLIVALLGFAIVSIISNILGAGNVNSTVNHETSKPAQT
jgi:ABC-type Fe3+ transport system permease subunit